jgi:hypothetical protein
LITLKSINLFLLLLTTSINLYALEDRSSKADFDQACGLFKEAIELNVSTETRFSYVSEHLKKRISSKDVNDAYEMIFLTEQENRYKVFKEAVEKSLNITWQCEALESLLSSGK